MWYAMLMCIYSEVLSEEIKRYGRVGCFTKFELRPNGWRFMQNRAKLFGKNRNVSDTRGILKV